MTATPHYEPPPPGYTNGPAGDEAPPPFPKTFKVNGKQVTPFVTEDQLKSHLCILGAFSELRRKVESPGGVPAWDALEPSARFAVFLHLAVYRFELWLGCILVTCNRLTIDELPPLDVLMVWHAYCLNPRWYYEDGQRLHLTLSNVAFPLETVHLAMGPDLTLTASTQQQERWQRQTKTPFDYLEAASSVLNRRCVCPMCSEAIDTPFINDSDSGWAQKNPLIQCKCVWKGDREALGVMRLAKDYFAGIEDIASLKNLAKVPRAPEDTDMSSLAGTLAQTSKLDDKVGAAKFLLALREQPVQFYSGQKIIPKKTQFATSTEPGHFSASLDWKLSKVSIDMCLSLGRVKPTRSMNRVLSAYATGEPFSLDLTGATMRQAGFVDKMVGMGWTAPGRFTSDDVVLKRCVARYHAFLDLMSSSWSSFFVPTLDIDLAWHTHQLLIQYPTDCIMYLDRFMDHDDKVEESHLANAFDLTARAWRDRYDVPYSQCGCPLPNEKTTTRIKSFIFRGHNETTSPECKILVGRPNEDADATHPSDHNALRLLNHPTAEKERQKREKELASRKERDEKAFKKGKMEPWVYERSQRGDQHSTAFFMPIPMYYYMPMGYGYADGNVCDGNNWSGNPGSCAVGAGACSAGAGAGGSCAGSGACGGSGGSACGGNSGGCGGSGGGCGGGGGGGGCGGGGGGGGC